MWSCAQAHALEQRPRRRATPRPRRPEARAARENVPETQTDARMHADEHVLDRGHRLEEADVLEGPADAERGDLVGVRPISECSSKRTSPASGT